MVRTEVWIPWLGQRVEFVVGIQTSIGALLRMRICSSLQDAESLLQADAAGGLEQCGVAGS